MTTMFVDVGHAPDDVTGLIPRHGRDGRPKIFAEDQYELPPNKRKGEWYTRPSSFVDVLDDKTNLWKWKMRNMLAGIKDDPSIMEEYAQIKEPQGSGRQLADNLADRAHKLGDQKQGALKGTALHDVTDDLDLGRPVGFIPPEFERDIEAYRRAVEKLGLERLAVEKFVVNDEYKAAGTADRVWWWEGRPVIGDLKTGGIEYSLCKYTAQETLYALANDYDPVTFKRTPQAYRGVEVDTEVGLIMWMPAGGGFCQIIPTDLKAGRKALDLAREVRANRSYWGSKRNMPKPIVSVEL